MVTQLMNNNFMLNLCNASLQPRYAVRTNIAVTSYLIWILSGKFRLCKNIRC